MRLVLFLVFSQFFVFAQSLSDDIRYLALGDSYTIGASVAEENRWPNQFIDSLQNLGYNIEKNDIIATSGWTTTSLLAAMEAAELDNDYNLISILIGVNNFYQRRPVELYLEEFPKIIDSALVLTNQDTNALFMVTIPDYGYSTFGEPNQESISIQTDLYNNIKDSIAKEYGIPVYNITEISRGGLEDPELVASDGLHPSAKQYDLWVDLILDQMLTGINLNTEKLNEPLLFNLTRNGSIFQLEPQFHGELLITDVKGSIVHQIPIYDGKTTSFELPNGAFVLNVISGSTRVSRKIIAK